MDINNLKLTYYKNETYQDVVKIHKICNKTKTVEFEVIEDPTNYWFDECSLNEGDIALYDFDSVINGNGTIELNGYNTPLYKVLNNAT